MIAITLGATRFDEALRAVRALGTHRYVAGAMHMVHALAFAATDSTTELEPGRAWADAILSSKDVDPASRDERLWRRSSDSELVALLDAYWTPGPRSHEARRALGALLERHGLPTAWHRPFDESAEDEMHPLAVDAGWELLPLAHLDRERHKGAIAAFGESLSFDSARFEEETAIPSTAHLYELPALGAVELIHGADNDGALAAPLVVWAQGNETYIDYVIRGVCRAAKLSPDTA